MKKNIIILLIILVNMNLFAQIQVDENQDNLYQVNENYIKTYRIFPTVNIYYYIKLNTRTGQIWQIKIDQKKANQLELPFSNLPFVKKHEEVDNRFTLYPTQNSWNYMLLDQVNGRIWQVTWDINPDKNKIIPLNSSALSKKTTTIENIFQLYPTRDNRIFLLLDKVNGQLWQINWSSKTEKSEIISIQ